AFLLYRFKETLKSEDILIISPNRVFGDYIGNVLPELGEERVVEIGMETLASELLDGKVQFQTFFEQTVLLLEKDDAALKARIVAKASVDFLKQIDAYLDHLEARSFVAAQWQTGARIVPAWHFEETWAKLRGLPLKQRMAELLAATEHKIFQHYKLELQAKEKRELKQAIAAMVRQIGVRAAYKGLFDWIGKPDLFKAAGAKLEYGDVFPLIYLKMSLEGVDNPRAGVKHLLIDEMQDYSPVQYAVIGKLFPCRKTILGDATQSVSPYGASTSEQIQTVLRAPAPMKLTKSYRSTWEIMQFALTIVPNADLEPMPRHGEPPEVRTCGSAQEMLDMLVQEAAAFERSDHLTLALIAKTQRQAEALHKGLSVAGLQPRLLAPESIGYGAGLIVCSAHMAKGLEFDRVIVADASAQNYQTQMDRNLLYVGATRAMHRLTFLAVGKASGWLPEAPDSSARA
ncbi:MAG: HelD family protein, partial [Terricaulis sp.]